MIDKVLEFLTAQMDSYLRLKIDPLVSSPFIQLANVAWQDTESVSGKDASSAFISLVNIEEDRISKSPENFMRSNTNTGSVMYKKPKVFLNLYLLFSVNLFSYSESLKRLSFIIQFFQYQNVFTPLSAPSIPDGVDELIFDLYTISFQDLNNLWGIMGSKYLPSVMYKCRLIIISEDFSEGNASLLTEIILNDKSISTI